MLRMGSTVEGTWLGVLWSKSIPECEENRLTDLAILNGLKDTKPDLE